MIIIINKMLDFILYLKTINPCLVKPLECLSPREVSASEDGTVKVWDYNPSKIVKNPQLDKLYNSSCDFLRDYLKYGTSPDNEVKKLCSSIN